MKNFLPAALLIFAAACLITSCKKEKPPHTVAPPHTVTPPQTATPPSMRTLKFVLYTDQDFSDDDHNISFALHIDNGDTSLLDSTVYTTQVKNIPNKAHQLVFEKKIPDDGTTLAVGFTYTIQHVGFSWYLDTCKANDKLKVIEYSFK